MADYETTLRDELVAAAARLNAGDARVPQRRRRLLMGAVAAFAILTPTAAAVSGIWKPFTEPDGLRRLTEPVVVASGSLDVQGDWVLERSASSSGPCLELRFASPQRAGVARAGGCGVPTGAHVASVGAGPSGDAGVAFGVASDAASTIEAVRGHAVLTTQRRTFGEGAQRYFVIETPRDLTGVCIVSRAADSRVVDRMPMGGSTAGDCDAVD